MIRVTRLQVAPVKALAVVSRSSVYLEKEGVAEDRRLFLMREDGSVVTQRAFPGLTRVRPELDMADGPGVLKVGLPDGRSASSELTITGEVVRTRLFGRVLVGTVVSGPVADALSDHVGERLRLVLTHGPGMGWDEAPVSVVSRASIADVCAGAPASTSNSVRFRMLVEVDGVTAYEEDSWVGNHVAIGQCLVNVTNALQRCIVINGNPETGIKDWDGVKALVQRRGRANVTVGVIGEVLEPGAVQVGDHVHLA
jgi:uncharacterized protein YcbX